MRAADGIESFIRNPVGRWLAIGPAVIWCDLRTRCGVAAWGVPQPDDVRAVLRVFENWDRIAPEFDALADISGVTAIDPESFVVLVDWARNHVDDLLRRVRTRISVVPSGLSGYAFAGIATMLASLEDGLVVLDARQAFRRLCRDARVGDALHDEVAAIVSSASGVPESLVRLRLLMRSRGGTLTVRDAARELGLSTRSLQRQLKDHDTSFRDELNDARFDALSRLLKTTDEKLSVVASTLGVTERVLARLIRERTSLTPSEYRVQLLQPAV